MGIKRYAFDVRVASFLYTVVLLIDAFILTMLLAMPLLGPQTACQTGLITVLMMSSFAVPLALFFAYGVSRIFRKEYRYLSALVNAVTAVYFFTQLTSLWIMAGCL